LTWRYYVDINVYEDCLAFNRGAQIAACLPRQAAGLIGNPQLPSRVKLWIPDRAQARVGNDNRQEQP
jgi:hypothetical protein